MTEQNKPAKGSVDALELTLNQLGIESIIAQTTKVKGERSWRVVLVVNTLETFTGKGKKFDSAARQALRKAVEFRQTKESGKE